MKNEPTTIIKGKVQRYKGNGRKFGYPTANINIQTAVADGVYFGYADLRLYIHQPALIFVGTPLTVGDIERRVEAHLLDIADEDYYNQSVTLYLKHFYRANQKFDTVQDLINIMKNDEVAARAWFAQKQNRLKLP